MCKVLEVSRSGYYKWLKAAPCMRSIENEQILKHAQLIFDRSKSTYGSPRITKELHKMHIRVSRVRVARLMHKAGMRSKIKKRYIITTDSKHDHKQSPNLLERNFKVGEIGKAWVSDITYIKTLEGWLYLTTILDLGNRKVIGWALSSTLKAKDTSIKAWQMAVERYPIHEALIFHSDQGVQYACEEFRKALKTAPQVKQSMSRKANCWDNAVAESFFKTIKVECLNGQKFTTRKQAKTAVFEYIEAWYNTKRLHSALGYRSPNEFENYLLNQKVAA